jgi:hypothetical protein
MLPAANHCYPAQAATAEVIHFRANAQLPTVMGAVFQ